MTRDLPSLVFDDDRLEELRRTGLLEEDSIENFDRLTRRAVEAVGADAGYVSLLSGEKQYLRGCVGLPDPIASERETPLEHSLCSYALDRSEPLVLEYLHEDDRGRVSEAIASVLAERGRRETVEVRFRDARGNWRILEAAARSLPEESSLGAILTSSRDVTEQVRWGELGAGEARRDGMS